jgi:hypothetical protein
MPYLYLSKTIFLLYSKKTLFLPFPWHASPSERREYTPSTMPSQVKSGKLYPELYKTTGHEGVVHKPLRIHWFLRPITSMVYGETGSKVSHSTSLNWPEFQGPMEHSYRLLNRSSYPAYSSRTCFPPMEDVRSIIMPTEVDSRDRVSAGRNLRWEAEWSHFWWAFYSEQSWELPVVIRSDNGMSS